MDSYAPRPNARLLFETAQGDTEIPLRDGVLAFGADPSCAVKIQGVGVAPHHAIIQAASDGFDLLDLMSRGGTRVNGFPISTHRLRSGDLISIGNAQFHYIEGGHAEAGSDPAKAAAASPSSGDTGAPDALPRYVIVVPARSGSALVLSLVFHVLLFLGINHLATPERSRPVFGINARFEGALVSSTESPTDAPLTAPPEMPSVPDTPERSVLDSPVAERNASDPRAPDVPFPSGQSSGLGASEIGSGSDNADGIGMPNRSGTGSGKGAASDGDGSGALGEVRPIPGTLKLRRYATSLREKGLDVVIALDTTGSMGPVLSEARARVNAIIMVLSAIVPRFRLGIVAYRDQGDAYIVKKSKLTPYHWEAVRFLDGLEPAGGGDTPEAVLAALREASRNYAWVSEGTRIMIIVGDAPPHPNEQSEAESIARSFRKDRGIIHTITCSALSTGSDSRLLKTAFGKLSTAGGGRALELTSGGSLSETLLPAIFGEEYLTDMRQAVEEVSTGLRARVARRLAEEGTPADVDAELRRSPPRNEFIAAMAQVSRPDRLGTYLDVLSDPKAPLMSRWAACTFAARTVRAANASLSTQGLFDSLSPDLDAATLRTAVMQARARALSDGFRIPIPPAGR